MIILATLILRAIHRPTLKQGSKKLQMILTEASHQLGLGGVISMCIHMFYGEYTYTHLHTYITYPYIYAHMYLQMYVCVWWLCGWG